MRAANQIKSQHLQAKLRINIHTQLISKATMMTSATDYALHKHTTYSISNLIG